MINIDTIRTHPEILKKSLKKRNQEEKIEWIDLVLNQDKKWRQLKQKADKLRQKRNALAEEINKLKKAGKPIESKIRLAKDLPGKISTVENELNELKSEINSYLCRLPNILHDSVPEGNDDEGNVPFKFFKEPQTNSFELKPHGKIVEKLNLANFKKAADVTGAGFNYLMGDLALLDMALQRFAIDELIKKGYTLVEPPLMLNKKAYDGTTDLSDFEKVMYKIDKEDLYLIATSEHPLIALHQNTVVEEKDLPLKYIGVSPCFRKEIGSHGVDSKGLFRMHQFNKVEQVIISNPEDSWAHFEELEKNSENLYRKLGLPFRVVNVCTGDMGTVAAKKYDIEAWYPREKKYKEVGSCSNCTDYQAVRSNIKFQKGEERHYVHTLNNTAIATSRTMVAILENYQQEDGTMIVPRALRKYMNGKKKLGDKKNERRKRTKLIWWKS